MNKCPCGGKRSYTWHYQHKVPQCAHSKHERSQYRNNVGRAWIPGSPILIPEIDPL